MPTNAEAGLSVCRASGEPTDLHYPPPLFPSIQEHAHPTDSLNGIPVDGVS